MFKEFFVRDFLSHFDALFITVTSYFIEKQFTEKSWLPNKQCLHCEDWQSRERGVIDPGDILCCLRPMSIRPLRSWT